MSIYIAFRIVRNFIRRLDPQAPKVYMLNDQDWYVAYGPYQAIAKAMDDTGMSRSECLPDYSPDEVPVPVSPMELERLIFTDDKDKRPFAEELDRRISAGVKFPEMFASTEY